MLAEENMKRLVSFMLIAALINILNIAKDFEIVVYLCKM